MINLIGRTIQHYQILLKVRETPTRILYKAYSKQAHSYVALEVVKKSLIDAAQLLASINELSQQNSKLSHANIASVSDLGIHNGLIYIVYDFSPAYTFRRLFNRVYSWDEMSRELVAIAHALAHAHQNGVVHGYLGPGSFILDEKQNPILFDFGLEQLITSSILANSPGTWINRWGFEYRAPEQLRGSVPDPRSDIYAFGIMMNEWLTGKTVASRTKQRKGLARLGPRRNKQVDSLSPVMRNFIQKCTSANPASRYSSMEEVFVILANGALNRQVTTEMVRRPLDGSVGFFKRGWSIVALVLGILLLIASGIFLMQSRKLLQTAPPLQSSSTVPIPTASRTQPPAAALIGAPTATPTADVVVEPTVSHNQSIFPLFEGTSLPSTRTQTLDPANAGLIIPIAQWGMGNAHDSKISPQGDILAVASSLGIFIFDAQDLSFKHYLDTRSSVNAIEFSFDGKILASGDGQGLIQLWDTATWTKVTNLPKGHTRAIIDLAFSPNGETLASIGLDDFLIQWNVPTLENSKEPLPPHSDTNVLVYSVDGSLLILGGADFMIHIRDAKTLALLQSKEYSSKILAFIPIQNTNFLVVAGSDRKVNILELSDEIRMTPLGSRPYTLSSVAVAPTGELIAAGDVRGGITIWNSNGDLVSETPTYIHADPGLFDSSGRPHTLSFSADGKLLFSALQDGTIRIFDSSSGNEVVKNLSFSANVDRLAISSDTKYALTQDKNQIITLWDIQNEIPLAIHPHGEIKDGDPFSKDSRFFAIAPSKNMIKVYEIPSMNEVYAFNSQGDVRIIQFINRDAQLAGGSYQGMQLWSISSGQELKVKPSYPGNGCRTIGDLQGKTIFSITGYQYIILNSASEKGLCAFERGTWATHIDENTGLIAYGGSGNLSVLNSRSNQPPLIIGDVEWNDTVQAVAINPNGNLLAAALQDRVIHIWDMSTRLEVVSLPGHKGVITNLRFTPDGKWLFSTSQDGTILIWGIPN